ncbi:MAG: thymidylate kinase [archaeon]|nr:thymidylate kinase [archaeon]
MWYVVDGMDGCGKSSAADRIKDTLESEGRRVLLITHPNRDIKVGQKEAAWLLKEGKFAKLMVTSYYIRDVLHSIRVMKKARKNDEYDDYIFVRYIMAVSYVPKCLCKFAYKFFKLVLPEPDMKFFIDVTAEAAMKRIVDRGEDLESFENMASLTKTRTKMLMFIPDRWHLIDNSGTFEETLAQIDAVMKERN